MITNWKNCFILLSLGILIGILIGVIICSFPFLGQKFLEISLVQIIQIIITILIAILITFTISQAVNRDIKRRDIILRVVDAFEEKISEVFPLGNAYMSNKDTKQVPMILIKLKEAGMLLSTMNKNDPFCKNKDETDFNQLKELFLKFRELLTDSPFLEGDNAYSREKIEDFENNYVGICVNLIRCRLLIYS